MRGIFEAVNKGLSMADVARHFGFEPNRVGFIKSPYKEEKTASCKLYSHSYYDFSTNTGDDAIHFASKLLGLNAWGTCRYLIEVFALPFSLSGSADNRDQIRRREPENNDSGQDRYRCRSENTHRVACAV